MLKHITWAGLLLVSITFVACKKDIEEGTIDDEIYKKTIETSGFTWYKNQDVLLNSGPTSPHTEPKLKTRYNSIAANKLNASGKVMDGAVFADGSLIVKEMYKSDNSLGHYVVMYKKAGHEYADNKGWIWAEYETDARIKYGASKKGSGCISCHNGSGSIDGTLMNVDHP